jgi:hypothetical protein
VLSPQSMRATGTLDRPTNTLVTRCYWMSSQSSLVLPPTAVTELDFGADRDASSGIAEMVVYEFLIRMSCPVTGVTGALRLPCTRSDFLTDRIEPVALRRRDLGLVCLLLGSGHAFSNLFFYRFAVADQFEHPPVRNPPPDQLQEQVMVDRPKEIGYVELGGPLLLGSCSSLTSSRRSSG